MGTIKRERFKTPSSISSKFEEMARQLENETDRGAALVGAAWLDATLESMLSQFLIDEPPKVDRLFSQNGPLSTFSARIDMTYCLGFYGPKTYHDLHLIREIRNDFAHHIEEATFNDQSIRDRCDSLRNIPPGLTTEPGFPHPARIRFVVTVPILMSQLWLRAPPQTHCQPGGDYEMLEHKIVRQ
jgi:hypothetical protein